METYSNKFKSALRWTKTAIMVFIMIHSAIMADILFHNASRSSTLALPQFWLAASVPLCCIIWMKFAPVLARKTNAICCYIITFLAMMVALGPLRAALRPTIANIAIWVNPTTHLMHYAYPPYFNVWVNFCMLLGAGLCAISIINLTINEQPAVVAKDS